MKLIPIGDLRARLYFQEKEEVVNSRGGIDTTYDDSFAAWGKIIPTSGMPYQITNFQEPKHTHRIFIRYNSEVDRRQRIRYKDQYFLITTINLHEAGSKKYLELLVDQQDVVI